VLQRTEFEQAEPLFVENLKSKRQIAGNPPYAFEGPLKSSEDLMAASWSFLPSTVTLGIAPTSASESEAGAPERQLWVDLRLSMTMGYSYRIALASLDA